MICLKVTINGEPYCTAGVGEFGCISTFVTWVRIEGDKGESDLPVQPGDVLLNVSGFKADQTPVHWGNIADHVAVGDKINIEIVELDTADPPQITKMLPEEN